MDEIFVGFVLFFQAMNRTFLYYPHNIHITVKCIILLVKNSAHCIHIHEATIWALKTYNDTRIHTAGADVAVLSDDTVPFSFIDFTFALCDAS